MGQEEVLNYLRECNEPKTRKEIAEAIGEIPTKVSIWLKSLIKWGDVFYIEHCREEACKKVNYQLFRRTRFFFINN